MENLIVLLVAGATLSAAPLSLPPAATPAVRELRVGPIIETKTGVEFVFAGPAAPCGERLKGNLSVFGSGDVPVDGTVTPQPEGGCSVRFELPFSAVGPEVLAKANLTAVAWSLRGELSGKGKARTGHWGGSIPRDAVKLTESVAITLTRFVRVREVSVGSLGFEGSMVTVDLEILQPLSFDLRFAVASYELAVAGRAVASGKRESFLLRAGRKNVLQLPVNLDHAGLLAVVGSAAWSGELEGVLAGVAKLRVPAGELEFPFEFPVKLSP